MENTSNENRIEVIEAWKRAASVPSTPNEVVNIRTWKKSAMWAQKDIDEIPVVKPNRMKIKDGVDEEGKR